MRRKAASLTYPLIITTFLLLISLPKDSTDSFRGMTVAWIAPVFGKIPSFWNKQSGAEQEQLQRLQLDNERLSLELLRMKDLLLREIFLKSEARELNEELIKLPEIKLHAQHLRQLLSLQLQSVPAQVIFRSPTSWNSSLWINVGTADNIAKHSPVVVGSSIVGVIDYVGSHQARVRLITDSGLNPSVRIVRNIDGRTWYLAKGELYGSGEPLWRNSSLILKGIGFNYDFPDEEGPARDLRTGQPLGEHASIPALHLIQVDDLLVTTGMDGVFPPGLHVAKVKQIPLLKEGDYFYELEAVPTAGNLDNLSLLFVLPPVGYDPDDQVPTFKENAKR